MHRWKSSGARKHAGMANGLGSIAFLASRGLPCVCSRMLHVGNHSVSERRRSLCIHSSLPSVKVHPETLCDACTFCPNLCARRSQLRGLQGCRCAC